MLYYKFTKDWHIDEENLDFKAGDILEIKNNPYCLEVFYNGCWIFDVESEEGREYGEIIDDENCETSTKNEFISYSEVANIIKLAIKKFENNNNVGVEGYSFDDLISWFDYYGNKNLKIKGDN